MSSELPEEYEFKNMAGFKFFRSIPRKLRKVSFRHYGDSTVCHITILDDERIPLHGNLKAVLKASHVTSDIVLSAVATRHPTDPPNRRHGQAMAFKRALKMLERMQSYRGKWRDSDS